MVNLMKAYKFEVLIIDFDQLGGQEIAETLQNANYPNDCISPSVESIEERDIGEWTDDHPLNKAGCSLEYQRLFQSPEVQIKAAIEKFKAAHEFSSWKQGGECHSIVKGMELALEALKVSDELSNRFD